MDYKKINQENYDLLWKVGFPFLYVTLFLDSGYKSRDSVLYNEGNVHYTFISKKERERLSKYGLILYSKGFKVFKKKLLQALKEIPPQIQSLQKVNLKKISNKELSKKFVKVANLSTRLWSDYFFTEYHTTDAVSSAILNNDKRYDIKTLKKNIQETSKIRYRIRKLINKVGLYSPNIGVFDI